MARDLRACYQSIFDLGSVEAAVRSRAIELRVSAGASTAQQNLLLGQTQVGLCVLLLLLGLLGLLL